MFVEHVLTMYSFQKSQMLSAVICLCVWGGFCILPTPNSGHHSMTPIALYTPFSSARFKWLKCGRFKRLSNTLLSTVPCQNKAK